LLLQKKPQEAVSVSEQAIATDDKRWEAYVTAASGYSAQQLYDDAIGMLQMALVRAPQERKQLIREAISEARKQASGAAVTPVSTQRESTPIAASGSPTQAEIVLWKSIENSNRPEDYRGYLGSYPNGVYVGVASSRLEAFDWKATEASENPEDFRRFIQEHPNSTYMVLASSRLDELDWNAASRSKDPEDYKRYIDLHPNGQHLSAAQRQYAELTTEQNAQKAAEEERMRDGWSFKWARCDFYLGCNEVNGTMTVSPKGIKWEEWGAGPHKNDFAATCAEINYEVQSHGAVMSYPRHSVTFRGDAGKAEFLKGVSHFCNR
jgi:tetratricopeptide (TPR) repeat protein